MDQYKFFGVPRRLKVLPAPGACPGCGSSHTTNWPRGTRRRPHTVGLCLDCRREWEIEAGRGRRSAERARNNLE
jgi:hypothetical protein